MEYPGDGDELINAPWGELLFHASLILLTLQFISGEGAMFVFPYYIASFADLCD